MSGGILFRTALQLLEQQKLAAGAEQETLAALEAARNLPLLQLLYEAGHEAQLERDELLLRAAGCFLCFAAGNLADDLIDGDCDYLDDPIRLGPSTQFLLQNAAYRCWLSSSSPPQALLRCADQLTRAAGPNHLEVRTERWTAALFQHVGEAIVGRQWAAYLEVLWGGTTLEHKAARVGTAIGIVAHVADDIRSHDRRWTSMSDDDKAAVKAWALSAATSLKADRLKTADHVLRASALVLGEAFAP